MSAVQSTAAQSQISGEEYAQLLNTLLEAERAGAKLLAAYVRELAPDSGLASLLGAVQRDEARNCSTLIHLLLDAGAEPTTAVGDFYRKGLEIREWPERLEFLNRGQAWVVRRLAAALPRISADGARNVLEAMHDSHLENIRACGATAVSRPSSSTDFPHSGGNMQTTRAPSERQTDRELVHLTLSGDSRAFEALMRRHNRTLYRTARAILRDDAEAEDVVQEAWLRAYRAFGAFRGESKLSTWLARIAANEALMRRRRNPKDLFATEEHDCISQAPGPEEEAQLSEARRLLETHIEALPDGYRTVFMLRALEEFTVGETAAALDIPEVTVRTRYFRARGLLRKSMATDFDPAVREAFAFAGARCNRIVRRVLAVFGALTGQILKQLPAGARGKLVHDYTFNRVD